MQWQQAFEISGSAPVRIVHVAELGKTNGSRNAACMGAAGDKPDLCQERHYRLVPAKKLDRDAIRDYRD